MKSIQSRLERLETKAKEKAGTGAVLIICDLDEYAAVGGDIRKLKGRPISGKESIVIIDDVSDDED
jgi:hypothetical protein